MSGVAGDALRFDGYTTSLTSAYRETDSDIRGGFTVEAWVALNTYPWNWVPVIDQEQARQQGFFFGIDALGHFALDASINGQRRSVVSTVTLPLKRWAHIAGTYETQQGRGKLTIYLNGKQMGELSVEGEMLPAHTNILIGRVRYPMVSFPEGAAKPQYPIWYSLDGILDEVAFYNRSRSADEIANQYAAAKVPAGEVLPWPKLPSGPTGKGRFGAYYVTRRQPPFGRSGERWKGKAVRMTKPVQLGASVACANFAALEADLRQLSASHIDFLHIDIMDGRFVDNFALDFSTMETVRRINIEDMLWRYEQTRNPRLLSLAEFAWREYMKYSDAPENTHLGLMRVLSNAPINTRGGTYAETAKQPAVLYMYTGKEDYLKFGLAAQRRIFDYHMLIDGIPSTSEWFGTVTSMDSHETCDITCHTWSWRYYLMATGEAAWGDRIKRACFNAAPGALTNDWKAVQYFSCPNQFLATLSSDHNWPKFKEHGVGMMAYQPNPGQRTACCGGNVHRVMPNYVIRM